jgi:hypothetical protein
MVWIRMAQGVKEHFPIRVSEWVMVWPAVGMWLAFQLQPDLFDTSPSYATMAKWADERLWGFICLLCAVIRLGALTVNGSFRQFPYSPHLRAGASLVGAVLWGQVCMSFADSFMDGGGTAWAPIMTSTFVLLELMNFYRSRVDMVVRR